MSATWGCCPPGRRAVVRAAQCPSLWITPGTPWLADVLDAKRHIGYKRGMKRAWPWVTLTALVLALVLGVWSLRQRGSHRYDRLIREAARRNGIDPALVKAVVWQESRFDPQARGRVGELGLMQLRELAAIDWSSSQGIRSFAFEQLRDPGTNIEAGTWYLAMALKRYQQTDDPVPYALADYNAGRGNVLRWNKGAAATNSIEFLAQVTFPGTRRYIQNVVRRAEVYRRDFD